MTTNASVHPNGRTAAAAPAVALYGLDASGKAHASWFGAPDADLARRAAALSGYRVLEVEQDEQLRELASKATRGKVFASGSAFVPFVGRGLFDQLCAAGGVTAAQLAELQASQAAAAKPAPSTPAGPIYDLPADRDAIKVRSLLLATEGDGEGWFEAIVTRQADADGVFVLTWRDYPDQAPFARHRDQLALLPPNAAQA